MIGFAMTGFAVATGLGFATAGFPGDGATAAFAIGRLRITTTGLPVESCERSGIGVFFLGSSCKSILMVLPSLVIVMAG